MNFFPRKISLFVSGPKKTVLRPGAQNGYFFHMQSYEISKSALCKISKVLKERTTFFIYLFFLFFTLKLGQWVIIRFLYLPGVMKTGLANFPRLIACYCVVCLRRIFFIIFFSLVLWLGVCLEVDVDRITILPLSLPPFSFFFSLFFSFSSLPTILSLK